jgi:signal transduction histidine kinase
MDEKIKILYVDDEPENLVGFKASLRLDYQIITATSVPEGISCLDNHPDIRIIFCDQRMPGKTGVDFFEDIRVSHPLPVRIMLTAYTDVESIIDAINKGNIFRFVKKPWTETDIVLAIEEANKFYMATSMLAIKNKELQAAYDELTKFAYSVSHDIRGPLVGVLGGINLAGLIDNVAEMRDLLAVMKIAVIKLDTYALSMHDYYTLQKGLLKITEIDFNAVIDAMKTMYSLTSKANNVDFKINVEQDEVFLSDKITLKIIIGNLLSNAFKYQDKTKTNKLVEVRVEVNNGMATIYVTDTGIGIVESHLGEIFNLFFRSNSTEVGSGIGLYNVKNALFKLNGEVQVSSVLNEGTTFKVTIPSL